MSVGFQSIWFRTAEWTEASAASWVVEHDFIVDTVRYKRNEEDEITHFIFPQFESPEDAEWIVLSDDFPTGVSVNAIIEDKSMDTYIKMGTQSADAPFTFIMSTEDVDRDGDIIRQKGIDLQDFQNNPVALFAHDATEPIGKWENVKVVGGKLQGDLVLAKPGTSEKIDTLRKLVEQRILKSVSVGFSVENFKMLKNGVDFIKTKLHECSLCSVPANAGALRIKANKIVPKDMRAIFLEAESDGPSGASTQKAEDATIHNKTAPKRSATITFTSDTKETKPMNISDRISAHNERLVAVKDRLTEIKSLLEADEAASLTEEDQTELNALSDEQVTISKSIDALNKIEAGLAAKAAPASSHSVSKAPARVAVKEKAGSLLVKNVTAALIAHMTDQRQSDVVDTIYGDDDRVKAVSKHFGINKSSIGAADTTTAGWAAELLEHDKAEFLTELSNVSVYAALTASPGAQNLSFGGNNTITIPRRDLANQSVGAATGLAAATNLGGQMGGSFVGEGGVIPVKKAALSSQTLSRYKLAVISAMTNEILEQSVPNIENIIRRSILDDTALAMDGALLDGVGAVAGVRPASIFAGVTGTASAGSTLDDIITDLKTLLAVMSNTNGAQPVLILNTNRLLGLSTITTAAGGFMFRDEILQGRLLNVPVIASTNVNATTVGMVDAGSFVGANDAPTFSVSDQAALTMANADGTAPSQAGDATDHTGGDLGTAEQVPSDGGLVINGSGAGAVAGTSTVGYSAQSMFQQYQTAIRMVIPTSFAMVRPGTAAYLTGVTW